MRACPTSMEAQPTNGSNSQSGFGWPLLGGMDQPAGHTYSDGVAIPQEPDDEFDLPAIIAPAGDLSCSMLDYRKFLQENLKALHGGDTKLRRNLMMHMHNDGEPGVGMGWGVQPAGDASLSSAHVGGAGTFTCIAAVSHSQDLTVALAVNAGSLEFEKLSPRLLLPKSRVGP